MLWMDGLYMFEGSGAPPPFDAPTALWHQAPVVTGFLTPATIQSLDDGFGLVMAVAHGLVVVGESRRGKRQGAQRC